MGGDLWSHSVDLFFVRIVSASRSDSNREMSLITPIGREIFRDCGIAFLMIERAIHWAVSWEENIEKVSVLFGRRKGDKMNILEIPQFIRDVVQLANDVKSAESVLAPQFPQLLADAEKIKTDGEALLGINRIAAPMAPPAA
jgi:hypothetical protein